MTESTSQRTKRKFRNLLEEYPPHYITSIQFVEDTSPQDIINSFKTLKKQLSKHIDTPIVWLLRTNRTDYGKTYGMVCLFTPFRLNKKLIIQHIDQDITYRVKSGMWNDKWLKRWLKNKELFNQDLFNNYYQLKKDGRKNISRVSLTNKHLKLDLVYSDPDIIIQMKR